MDLWVNLGGVVVLVIVIILFSFLLKRSKGSGATQLTVMSGATNALLNRDKQKAAEVVADQNAQKKLDEQSAFGPPADRSE